MPKVPFLTAGRERTLEPRDKLKDRSKTKVQMSHQMNKFFKGKRGATQG